MSKIEEILNSLRDYPRYDISIEAYIRNITKISNKALNSNRINLYNISKSGIRFKSNVKLKVGYFYELKLKLLGSNIIETVIQMVREEKEKMKYDYGAILIGLNDYDKSIIDTFSILHKIDK